MTVRSIYILGFILICGLLGTSLYLQFVDGIMPCPLCTLQRLSFGILGILFFLGLLLHNKRSVRMLVNSLSFVFSSLGIFFAGRQIWLQHFPSPDNTECGVSIQYMMQILPVNQVLQKIFEGTAECTQRGWEFLNMNMAEWALLWFVGFLAMSFWLLIKEFKTK